MNDDVDNLSSGDGEKAPPVVVPWRDLEPATLSALIESFILREGTDYGAEESRFTSKIEQVRRQLEEGTVLIVFDPNEESVNLLTSIQASSRKSR